MTEQPELRRKSAQPARAVVHDLKIAANGLNLAVWEWEGSEPAIFFAHATGFHGRLWDRIIAEFPDRRCLSIDLRGHGRSDKPAPPYPWRNFGNDIAAIANAMRLRGVIGVAHSLGGHAMALAAALDPQVFRSLLLIDPVIQEPEKYTGAPTDAAFIAKRRAKWTSVEEMFERFRSRPPFASWKPEILHDYCKFGLLPARDGDGLELACPPEIEAAIYPAWNLPNANLAREIREIVQPAVIMRSEKRMTDEKFDLSTSATDPLLASRMQNARDVVVKDCSHFIPMERPDVVVGMIRELHR